MLRFRCPPRRLSEAPTVDRCLLIACLALMLGTASAETPTDKALTEQKAVELALRRAPLADVLAGSVLAEEGRARVVSVRPNPELSYSREETFGASGTSEQYVTVSQSIDLGGRRGLRADAAAHRVEATQLDGQATRIELVFEVRLRFYEVLYQQQRVVALETWRGLLQASNSGQVDSLTLGRSPGGEGRNAYWSSLRRPLSAMLR